MKWSITQLRKYQGKPFEFNQTANFEHLKESLDLIDLSEINVDGKLTIKSNEVIADIHVTGTYTMPCARTLVPVEVPLDVETAEIFDLEGSDYYTDEEEQDEHYHLATDGMINIKDIVEDLVIIEKPMRAYSDNSDQMLTEGNGWEVIDEDEFVELVQEQDQEDDGSNSNQVDPRLRNYNNYTIKNNNGLINDIILLNKLISFNYVFNFKEDKSWQYLKRRTSKTRKTNAVLISKCQYLV